MDTFRDALNDIEACGDIQVAYTAENGALFLHGAATVFYETKLAHGCKKVGHIEDLVVLPESRRMGIARALLFRIRQQSAKECYKVILDCREELVPFYESCSLVRHGSQMSYYFH
jgi:glucosamine-phosphate N-acetyltransferase